MPEPLVSNVSDTARWVAAYRAWETARPDALFRDPFAERLAGARGQAITELMPKQARNGWPLVVRTRLIDDLILASVSDGCDCVINLAAGLYTRPYRMSLPATLRWAEIDLPAMIEEKERLVDGEQPACRLSRHGVDLSDPAARPAILETVTARSSSTLVIAEGLLVYLQPPIVVGLAQNLLRLPSIRWWVFDLASPGLLDLMRRSMGSHLTKAPMVFGPDNGVAFFESMGWRTLEIQSFFRAAARLRRLPWPLRAFSLFPDPDPRSPGKARWSAAVRLTKSK
jgi:methyltransferase (TIGR00027 family)